MFMWVVSGVLTLGILSVAVASVGVEIVNTRNRRRQRKVVK